MTSNYRRRLQLLDAIERWAQFPNTESRAWMMTLLAEAFPVDCEVDDPSPSEMAEFETLDGQGSTESLYSGSSTSRVPATAIRVSGGPEIELPLQDPSFRPNPYIVTRVRR